MSGNLYGCRTYLIGAMDRVEDFGAGWREWITPLLHELGVVVFNPVDKPIKNNEIAKENASSRNERKKWKENGQYELFQTVKTIRATDLRMVDTSDFLIAHIDMDVHHCGTYEEIVTANRQKKPVLVHVKQGKKHCPDWLFMMLDHNHIFNKWEDLFDYLKGIDNGEIVDSTGRWVFFDLESEIKAIKQSKKKSFFDKLLVRD